MAVDYSTRPRPALTRRRDWETIAVSVALGLAAGSLLATAAVLLPAWLAGVAL